MYATRYGSLTGHTKGITPIMSTKTQQNVMATSLVALMLVLGCLFGYVMLGGFDKNTADATTPKDATTSCLLCATDKQQGTGGNIPSPLGVDSTTSGGGGGNR